jgi:hypothetical protein
MKRSAIGRLNMRVVNVHVNTAESSHALIKRRLTFKQYRTALAYFQESCGRRRLAEVDRRTLLDFRHFLAEREKRGGYVAAPSRLTNRLSGHGPLCRIEVITSESRTLGVPPNTLFSGFSAPQGYSKHGLSTGTTMRTLTCQPRTV